MTGEELKALRKAHGLTRRALGEMLGYHQNYIARLERGDIESGKQLAITPRFEKLVRMLLGQKKSPKKDMIY